MPSRTCLTILVLLSLSCSSCVKAVAPKMLAPTDPGTHVTLDGPYDSEIPAEYIYRLSEVSSPADEAVPLTFIAIAEHFTGLGEVDKAIHFLDRASDEFVRIKNRSGEAMVWSRKIILLTEFGLEQEAQSLVLRAEEKWIKPPLRAFNGYIEGHRALLRGNFARALLSLAYSLQDNTEFSDDLYLRMLRRDVELDTGISAVLAAGVPKLLAIYGMTSVSEVRKDAAGVSHLHNALVLNQELRLSRLGRLLPAIDFDGLTAETMNFMGLDAWVQGDNAEACRQLVSGTALSRMTGLHAAEMRGLMLLGEIGLQGEYAIEGRGAAELLRDRADHFENVPFRVWARQLLSRYEQKEKRNEEAIRHLDEAVAIIEMQRFGLMADMFDEVCRRQRRAVYESLVELLSEGGMIEKALTVAEKAKSLMTVDLLAGEDLGRTPDEKDLLKQETAIGTAIRNLQRGLLMVSDETVMENLREQLRNTEKAYRGLLDRIGSESKENLSLIAVKDLDPADLQKNLDNNTTIFDYFTTPGALYVWVVNREHVQQERIDLRREGVRSLVYSFLSAIRDKDRKRTEALSQKAYDLLLKPVIPFVSGDRIGFVTDDALVYLPFAAMRYRGRFLAEGFSIFYLSEAGLLEQVLTEAGTTGMRMLAFVNPDHGNETPDRPRALHEVEQIKKRLRDTTVLAHEQATEAKTENMFSNYDILHFAVRGQFFADDVLNSGLLLTPGAGRDGRLTVREIFGRRFHGRAVFLSGCDPVPENDPEGKALTSLQRSLLGAGTPSVISSLWLVNDKAAARLVDIFYRNMEKKESPADALRAAQLRLIQEGYPPYLWAAFVLTGRY